MTEQTTLYADTDTDTETEGGPGSSAPRSSAAAFVKTLRRGPVLSRGTSLAGELLSALSGRSALAPAKGDRRFDDPAWSGHPLYRLLGQSYLALEKTIHDIVEAADVEWPTRERARFAAGILSSALSPTNTLLGNPAALKHSFDTAGASLIRGGRNLARDARNNRGMPLQVDSRPFRVGETAATTPGQVVYRNEVVEIIQYTPTTPQVSAVPLLVVWSVINRYYMLDLAPDRSFIEFALNQGIPVFVTSWRNPTRDHAHWNIDTYAQALLDAMDAVREISGSEKIGTVGLCAGGQLLAATMGHLAAVGDDRIAYACFGVSQLDMSVPNVAGIALHPALTAAARTGTKAVGIVDGRDISAIFSWLRPNELVWSHWVNNYLMGNEPSAFDILAWTNDTTRLAGAMQIDLLRIAEHNLLAEPRGMTVLGTPVDLGAVTADVYLVGAETDHLVPWRGAFGSARLFGGEATFILSGGGHIQHLVNPPGNPKARYRTNPMPAADADAWVRDAKVHGGTWWEHWSQWVLARSGESKRARKTLGNKNYRPMEPAPGRYVREQ
jgi:polyhydroxyalkanoate synthase